MTKAQKARARDEGAIRKLMADYTAASNRHDAKAMSMFWAEDGDSISATGYIARGRAEIEKAALGLHSRFFKQAHVTRTVERVRFVRSDVAIADGSVVTVGASSHDGHSLPPLKSLYTVVTVKKSGRWMIVVARSMMPVPPVE